MCDIDRRDFIRLGSVGAAGFSLTGAAVSSTAAVLEADRPVLFHGDGLNLSPREYADVLAGITASGDLEEDYYSNGGIVEDLEKRMAEILGKATGCCGGKGGFVVWGPATGAKKNCRSKGWRLPVRRIPVPRSCRNAHPARAGYGHLAPGSGVSIESACQAMGE